MITAIVQARMNSVRLPGKVMMNIGSKPAIKLLHERLKKSNMLERIIIATGPKDLNKSLINYLKRQKIEFFCGSENDVLERYFTVAEINKCEVIVRITSDCPFVDYKLVDKIIKIHIKNKFDYSSNVNPATFPDGLDIEVFSFAALQDAFKNATTLIEREHVTPYIIKNNKLKKYCLRNQHDLSHIRWTLDTKEDLEVLRSLYEKLDDKENFNWLDLLKTYRQYENILSHNVHFSRNYSLKNEKNT